MEEEVLKRTPPYDYFFWTLLPLQGGVGEKGGVEDGRWTDKGGLQTQKKYIYGRVQMLFPSYNRCTKAEKEKVHNPHCKAPQEVKGHEEAPSGPRRSSFAVTEASLSPVLPATPSRIQCEFIYCLKEETLGLQSLESSRQELWFYPLLSVFIQSQKTIPSHFPSAFFVELSPSYKKHLEFPLKMMMMMVRHLHHNRGPLDDELVRAEESSLTTTNRIASPPPLANHH
jgi:hypothetical protein